MRSAMVVEPPTGADEAGEAAALVADAGTDCPKLKSLGDSKAAINVCVDGYELGPTDQSFAISEPEAEALEDVRQGVTSECQEMCRALPAAITTENSTVTSETSREGSEGQCDSDMRLTTGSKTRNVAVAGASRHRTETSALDSNFASDTPTSNKHDVVQVRALHAPVDALIGDINGKPILKPVSRSQDRAVHSGIGKGLEKIEKPEGPPRRPLQLSQRTHAPPGTSQKKRGFEQTAKKWLWNS